MEAHGSVLRPSAEMRFSLIKFKVDPESTSVVRMEKKPISETDRWISFEEKREIEVRSHAVLKSLTS